ncbi:MAG TPA: hypothetical protein VI007_02305 [bacterium]
MKREREELRRGIRSFIQDAGVELAEFTGAPAPKPEEPSPRSPSRPDGQATRPSNRLDQPIAPIKPATPGDHVDPPILRLVRDVTPETSGQPALEEMTIHLPKKGVCAAYFTNKRCWELPDAYCNHALHICRLRECPVYDLHREEMERRFAARFKHLW